MITQRTRSGGTEKAFAIAGNAMFIMESSDTTSAPAAATHRDIPRMMTRHARSDRLGGPRRGRARWYRGGLRDGHAPVARRRARALRTADLGDLRSGRGARRDDVRGLVGRAEAPRPHERSRVSRHHRGPAGPPGLALASLSAVKPDLVDIEIGATAEVVYTVDDSKTAHAMGNRGVHVFATPFVIGMLEDAAGAVMRPHLPSGAGSVGTMVEMKHLAPTPVGLKVRAKATLLESDGKRFLFAVEAWDDREKIAEGRHERFFVPDMEKFLARAMKKSAG